MNTKTVIMSAAVGSLIALGALTTASAADEKKADMEKCYGVVKAGKNDCASASKAHACAGQSKTDGGNEFISVPKGTCAKLVNGSTMAKM